MNISDTLQQIVSEAIGFGSKLIAALAILLIGIFVAKVVRKIITKLLEAVRIDKLGDRLNEVDFVQKASLPIKISSIIGGFVYYFIVLIFLIISAEMLQMQAITDLLKDLVDLFPKILTGLILLVVGTVFSNLVQKLIETTLSSIGVASSKIVAAFVFYFLFINFLVVAVAQTGISTAFLQQNISIIIGGGVLAFAIGYGLAARDVMANFLGSFYSSAKVKIGDVISLDDIEGEVIALDKTSITIATVQGKRVIYPIRRLLTDRVTIIDTKRLTE